MDLASIAYHSFNEEEIARLRCRLLGWYDRDNRSLPWRDRARNLSTPVDEVHPSFVVI